MASAKGVKQTNNADVVPISSHKSAFRIPGMQVEASWTCENCYPKCNQQSWYLQDASTCMPPACHLHAAAPLRRRPACGHATCMPVGMPDCMQLHPVQRRRPQHAPPACRLHTACADCCRLHAAAPPAAALATAHPTCMPTACAAPPAAALARPRPTCMPPACAAPPAAALARARPTCMPPACRVHADCTPTACAAPPACRLHADCMRCTPCCGVGQSTSHLHAECMPTACAAPPAAALARARPTCMPPACRLHADCMRCTPCSGAGQSTSHLHAACMPTAYAAPPAAALARARPLI